MLARFRATSAPEYRTMIEAMRREKRAAAVRVMDELRGYGYIVRLSRSPGCASEHVEVACTDGCGRWTDTGMIGMGLHWSVCQPCMYVRWAVADF